MDEASKQAAQAFGDTWTRVAQSLETVGESYRLIWFRLWRLQGKNSSPITPTVLRNRIDKSIHLEEVRIILQTLHDLGLVTKFQKGKGGHHAYKIVPAKEYYPIGWYPVS